MSQAEDLLNSISETEISTYSADPATEEHIVVGNDRFITVPDSLKRIAVQYDHNIETVTFDCPRYWDEHDMSTMKVYVNCMRPDGRKIPCLCTNVVPDEFNGSIMHFDWTIKRDVSLLNGPLRFLVCVKKVDADGNEENHWNSELNNEMYVSEGMECNAEIERLYPDVITHILTRLDAIEINGGGDNPVGPGVTDYDELENQPIKNVTSDSSNAVALRDLESGVYRLTGRFIPYTGSKLSLSFTANQLINVITKTTGTHVQIFYPLNNMIQFVSIMVDSSSEDGYAYERTNINLNELQKKTKVVTINLPASGWTGSGSIYSQNISNSNITANSQVDLRPSPEQSQELLTAEISMTAANDAGVVTVFAIGGKPTSNYVMQAIVSEVDVA